MIWSHAEAIQLENVVRRAHQRPFRLHLVEAAQEELSEAPRLLDLTKYRLDNSFARGIDRSADLRVQLARHAVDDRRGLGQPPARTWAGSLAMLLLPRRDV